jgi:hypothetical protein
MRPQPFDLANHDSAVLPLHAANHPEVQDLLADMPSGHVALLYCSPPCAHFAKAKAGTSAKVEEHAGEPAA